MTKAICETCGTQYPNTPAHCAVCEDERQYVGAGGQTWTTHEALKTTHALRLQDEAGVLGIGLTPTFAINQRALYLPTDAGNILWESLSLVTDEAVAALQARGGVDLIAISHPHFYAAMLEWSEAFGNVPILLHEADREWVRRPSPNVRFWRGDAYRLSDAVTLINRHKAQVIDVSTPEEFAAAHIVGSKNLPLQALDTAKGLPSNKKLPLVVVCARGARAAQAKPKLMGLGHEEVHVLAGGLSAWQQANLPVEKGA